MITAVRSAYLEQDTSISPLRQPLMQLWRFLNQFLGRTATERGYFFTLSQDFFVERVVLGGN